MIITWTWPGCAFRTRSRKRFILSVFINFRRYEVEPPNSGVSQRYIHTRIPLPRLVKQPDGTETTAPKKTEDRSFVQNGPHPGKEGGPDSPSVLTGRWLPKFWGFFLKLLLVLWPALGVLGVRSDLSPSMLGEKPEVSERGTF